MHYAALGGTDLRISHPGFGCCRRRGPCYPGRISRLTVVGDQEYLRAMNGLSVEAIVRTVQSAVEEINSLQQSVDGSEEPCVLRGHIDE